MNSNNKELIDLIRERLKSVADRPYKEGAWETYKAKYEPTRKVRLLAPLWGAAAVAALVGFIFLFSNRKDSTESVNVVETERETVNNMSIPKSAPTDSVATEDEVLNSPVIGAQTEHLATVSKQPNSYTEKRRDLVTLDKMHLQTAGMPRSKSVPKLTTEMHSPGFISFEQDHRPVAALKRDDDLIAGQQIVPNLAYQRETEPHVSPKKMRLTDRLELGAFVSPSTTDRSFDLGGGLVFAYRFSDKLAIRTGASFNQYEVGMLKADVQEIGEIKKRAAAPIKNSDKVISKEATSLRTNNFFIPNLNAVTGKVQTLDIPLEVRYNLNSTFYATGGVSYAAVLSQERFDHYEESAGIATYSSASDSGTPATSSITTIETTQKSEDENINTNGFGGFVNLSVGKKTNLGKTMKVSVEPFVKFPVGQFRRADMNYTNGGIRVITSF